MTDDLDDFDRGVNIGAAHVRCPECGRTIAIQVKTQLGAREDGRQMLIIDPDMADLWAHAWTHE